MNKKISRREALKRIGISAISVITPLVGKASIIGLDNCPKDKDTLKINDSSTQKSYNSYSNYYNYVNYSRYFNYANYGSYCSLYNPYPEK